ncbi:MAG: thioredoxin fold domain-containing protein [Sulfurimonas sp.]|nr:thioredoxin fold domain-containing protein [Sulfurimonas sp.]
MSLYKIFVLFMIVLFSSPLVAFTITQDKVFQEIYKNPQNQNKKILMIYTANNCPQCAYMKEKIFKEKEVFGYMSKHFVVIEKNTSTDELPEGFSYFGIPTMFIIDSKGNTIDTIVGSARAKDFLEMIKKY